MCVKIYIRKITKNHAADPEIGFRTKSILKPYEHSAVMPTAWELTLSSLKQRHLIKKWT